ncbi:BspA family leucine-rich repeat surface protein [Longimonas sp.]|uniref:BspA family leucine-rich repeat surface protein n=1 Tax=Longimonas sp. TaxID=2039626 RepID=UPI003976A23E
MTVRIAADSSSSFLYALMAAGLLLAGSLAGPTPAQAQDNSDFYLDDNGVTVKCPDANVGDTGEVDGTTYTKRDRDGMDDLLNEDGNNPDLATTCTSGITDMGALFNGEDAFDQDIGSWDVSSVTTMRNMFDGAGAFNQDIGSWNVSNVENMLRMFWSAESFNQDISSWDVSSVTDMSRMFVDADDFSQDIGDWDVSSVTDMNRMFRAASSFDQDIGSWDVSNVTDMRNMFEFAPFNQDIGDWDVSSVENMQRMFKDASSFNQDIGDWDVSNVSDMRRMFEGASDFDQNIDTKTVNEGTSEEYTAWDVSSVTRMDFMFLNATSFNGDIGDWDVSGGPRLVGMFSGASSFNQDIGNWDVSSVTDVFNMFENASAFNQDLGSWDVSNVTSLSSMFENATSFDQDLGAWNVSNVTFMGSTFDGSGLSAVNYDRTLIGWAGRDVESDVDLDAGGIEYCNSNAFREHLTQAYNWTFNDDGQQTDCPDEVLAGNGSADVSSSGSVTLGDTDARVDFDGVGGSGRVTAARFDDMPRNVGGVNETNISPYRVVIVAEAGLSFSDNTEVRFDEAAFGGISDPNDITIYSRPVPGTGDFAELTTSYDDSEDEIVATTGGFSEFVFASDSNPLPVELTDFTATHAEESVSLQWETASEENNAGFEVQRADGAAEDASDDDVSWTTLGFVESEAEGGTTDEPQSYSFTAEEVDAGTHTFRLRQVDTDGTESFSDPVEVDVTLDAAYELSDAYPNPSRSDATLELTVQQTQPVTATVYDMLGRRVTTLHRGEIDGNTPTELRVNADELSSGTYFVRVEGESFKATRRLTVVR